LALNFGSNGISREVKALKLRLNQFMLRLSGLALIALAVALNWRGSVIQGQDFGYVYSPAVAIATGAPLYDATWQQLAFPPWGLPPPPLGIFYPPSTGFITLPLAAFPYSVAKFIWFVLLQLGVIFGVRTIVRLVRPDASQSTWLLAAGMVLLCSSMRWGITHLQGAPLVFALLAFLVMTLHKNRPGTAFAIAAVATAFKFTVALPFLGLLLLHKRYGSLIATLALVGMLNLVGFWRVGGMSALRDYRLGLGRLESMGTVNSPDPWDPQSSPRLDWPYMVAFGVVGLWLVHKMRQIRKPVDVDLTTALLAPMICLSVLCVYHHHYDISPMLLPLLLMLARFREVKAYRNPWVVGLMAPLIGMAILLPIQLGQRVFAEVVGPMGQGLLNLLFPLATTSALIGSLLVVRQMVIPSESNPVTGLFQEPLDSKPST
jgi:hypothetical protein